MVFLIFLRFHIANTLLFMGASLETIAVLKLLNSFNKVTKKIYIFLMVFSIVGFHLVIFIHNVESIRIVFTSFWTATFIVLPAYRLIRNRPSSLLMKVMGYLYFLVIISLLSRCLVALLSNHNMGLFTPGISQSFSFLTLYLTMILGNIGFILL